MAAEITPQPSPLSNGEVYEINPVLGQEYRVLQDEFEVYKAAVTRLERDLPAARKTIENSNRAAALEQVDNLHSRVALIKKLGNELCADTWDVEHIITGDELATSA